MKRTIIISLFACSLSLGLQGCASKAGSTCGADSKTCQCSKSCEKCHGKDGKAAKDCKCGTKSKAKAK